MCKSAICHVHIRVGCQSVGHRVHLGYSTLQWDTQISRLTWGEQFGEELVSSYCIPSTVCRTCSICKLLTDVSFNSTLPQLKTFSPMSQTRNISSKLFDEIRLDSALAYNIHCDTCCAICVISNAVNKLYYRHISHTSAQCVIHCIGFLLIAKYCYRTEQDGEWRTQKMARVHWESLPRSIHQSSTTTTTAETWTTFRATGQEILWGGMTTQV